MRVRLTRQAISDVAAIADYIHERNRQAAIDTEIAIRSAFGLLAEFPKIGRERAELGVRSIGVPRFPYTIYYRVEAEEIWIVHIRDDRRKPPAATDL